MFKNRQKDAVIRVRKLKCSLCKNAPKYEFRIDNYLEYACIVHMHEVQGMLELQSTTHSTYEAK